jgi:acetylornithine deacetylase
MNAPLIESTKLSAASLAMIRQLVSFNTTSRESNLALIEWVSAYLRDHGIESRLTFDDAGKKANLFATIGPQIDGGIVLSGHTDVVPVDGQNWNTEPWQATQVGDRLVGRGVCDMKSFIAIALALVPEMTQHDLKRPLHFALSYDEEVGCIGVRRLIADLANVGLAPGGCIVGEPTGMELVVAHKGKRSYRCRVRGFEAHSALTPKGVNAVEIACEVVTYLRGMAKRFREKGRFDHDYDVPFTTVHVGTIKGGTALNIVPRDCEFIFEFRFLPFDDPDELLRELQDYAARFLPEMHAVAADTGILFEQLSALPGFDTGADSVLADLGRCCNHGTVFNKVSFGAEASLFHNAGIPAILCGPGHIAQAHQPNEWVTLEQVARCEAFLRRLIDQVSSQRA